MSNVVSLRDMRRPEPRPRLPALVEAFAAHRRAGDDVFWLKENAEFLGILACSGAKLPDGALAPFDTFYEQIEKRLRFFPQYYRFLVSVCLDLEDLGMGGNKASALCTWAAQAGLADAELSDLQRAEARRLFARRGIEVVDDGLTERLHSFMNRTDTFVMPNKKAAYELTHIVFYLSEYGARDPGLDASAITSLEYAGLLAYLDQNMDLLAEVCVALRFAGRVPSAIWEASVEASVAHATITPAGPDTVPDTYHEYLVGNWALRVAGHDGFEQAVPEGRVQFNGLGSGTGALRPMSECMFELDDARNGDWDRMRPHVELYLGPTSSAILSGAEQSTDKFEAFFAGFARAGTALA
ncbi:hypothetical protein C1J03_09310 [Sulfitobacter sp. SK012]|uniref:DUF6902 family protein n=1 Tax=Sulfitobacter sp. SK012 TaxID=1389005 RepID=UPI000E0C23F2|nr:hypothetical protein [Sulfitobacter sp. SK012]AXI46201.1 hypothetical protein C1J03_09310 [Sulfitobacter sp. SK012]